MLVEVEPSLSRRHVVDSRYNAVTENGCVCERISSNVEDCRHLECSFELLVASQCLEGKVEPDVDFLSGYSGCVEFPQSLHAFEDTGAIHHIEAADRNMRHDLGREIQGTGGHESHLSVTPLESRRKRT